MGRDGVLAGLEGPLVLPGLLPFGLDRGEVVGLGHGSEILDSFPPEVKKRPRGSSLFAIGSSMTHIVPSAWERLGGQPLPHGKSLKTPGRAPDSAPKQLARRALRLAQTRFVGFQGNSPRPPRAPAKLFQYRDSTAFLAAHFRPPLWNMPTLRHYPLTATIPIDFEWRRQRTSLRWREGTGTHAGPVEFIWMNGYTEGERDRR